MGKTLWGTHEYSSLVGVQAWSLLREATLESRLDAVKEVVMSLLHEVDVLRDTVTSANDNPRLPEAVRRFETQLIVTALEKTHGNQARAAKLLGVKHTTLNAKIKRYQISFRASETRGAVGDHEIAA